MEWKFWSRQRKITAYFIDETNEVFRAKKKYKENKFEIKLNGEVHTYIVDPKRILHLDGKTPLHLYAVGNPIPLNIDGGTWGENAKGLSVDSVGFTKILEDKVVRDLFSHDLDNKLQLILILVIAGMCLTAVSVLIQAGVIKIGGA